jgi:hypothetical protein
MIAGMRAGRAVEQTPSRALAGWCFSGVVGFVRVVFFLIIWI